MDTAAAPRRRLDLVAYLKLFRFPLVFTAIADSAAGYVLMNPFKPDPVVLALLAICSAGLYFFGMAMNDIADLARDREIAPNRVLPSGRISPRQARFAALSALGISLAAIPGLGFSGCPIGQRLVFWTVAVAAILCYDFHVLKVPPMMGVVRACNFLIGAGVGSEISYNVDAYGMRYLRPWECLLVALPEFLYVTALTFISTLEDGPIRRGRVFLGAALMSVAALLAIQWVPMLKRLLPGSLIPLDYVFYMLRNYFKQGLRLSGPACLTAAALVGWIGLRARRARERKEVMLLVRDGIGGIIVLNAILLMSVGSTNEALLLTSLLLPAALSVALFKKLA